MSFVGKFDAKLPTDGSVAHSQVHVAPPPADAIVVPDAHLLFGADFKRDGVDLILSNADRELVVHDYFKGEHRHPLASPDGARLTGDIVNALTGQVQYAQAGAPDPVAHVIGHVTKLTGSATAIRNGVSIILNNGDNVEKGDVVATGSDSALGVTFIDGTVFGLSSNARMVLNEMVYDPNGSNNSSLISLVAGTISFVAGETAKHGDMKVDTPVATMGIRGTAVLVEIDFNVPGQNGLPDAKFQVLVEPDGTTGSYILFDKTTLDPIATVNRAGQQVNINQNGVSYTNSPLTPELQKLISDVFTQKFSNVNDTNTKLTGHFTDSIVPPSFVSFKGPDGITVTAVSVQANSLGNGPSQTQGAIVTNSRVDVAPTVVATSGGFAELTGVTGSANPDATSGFINFHDVNRGDQPTASAKFQSFAYQNAQHQDITLKLTPPEQAAVQAVEVALNVVQDPTGLASGTALWSYTISDSALDFLGANETLTLTYLVTVSNNYVQSIKTTTVPITITITGANDAPKIYSVAPQTIAFLGGTNVAGGDLTAHVPTSGTITFDDPDLTDTHTVKVADPVATLTDPTTHVTTPFTLPPTPLLIFNQALTASITDAATHLPTDSTGTGLGSISWSLAALPVWLGDFIPQNDVLTLTYVITVTDSQGATATQDITVTITGTDTPAVVWIATTGTGPAPDGLWSTGGNWETGNAPTFSDDVIVITDQLEGLTPTYPATINSAANAGSVSIDNFGGAAPELINRSSLQVFGAFTIQDHSTDNPEGYVGPELNNQGTLTIDGPLDLLNDAVLLNSGGIGLWGGGTFGGASTITNTSTGLIEVVNGTLDVGVDIANSGQVAVEYGATLALNGASIDGTAINEGTLNLTGNAVLKNGTVDNAGQLDVSGAGNAFTNETVNNGAPSSFPGLFYNLQKPAIPTDGDPGLGISAPVEFAETINVTGTLTLSGTSIGGGTISGSGTIDVIGNSTIAEAVVKNGQIIVEANQTLTLDGTSPFTGGGFAVGTAPFTAGGLLVSGSTITNHGTLNVDANNGIWLDTVTVNGGSAITNSGSIEIIGSSSIANQQVTNHLLTIDGGQTLTLSGATIHGGVLNAFTSGPSGGIFAGDIDVTGSSTISNAQLNNGDVTLSGNVTLTLTNDTVTGANFTDTATGATIQIEGNTVLDGVTVSGGAVTNSFINAGTTITVDGGQTLTLRDGVTVSGGTISNSGTLDLESSTGAALNGVAIAGGGAIQVDGIVQVSTTPLILEGGTSITGGTLTVGAVSGYLVVEGAAGATLDHVGVTNDKAVEVLVGSDLVLDDGATVGNGAGALTVDGGATLTLNDAEITGGAVNDFSAGGSGTIDVTGSSTISDARLNNGDVTLSSNVTLNLDGTTITGASFNDAASGAVIQIDGGDTLALSGATINGGAINAFTTTTGGIVAGDINVTGFSTISNAHLNNGNITLGSNVTLTLDGSTVTGSSFDDIASGAVIQIDGGDTLTVSGATINGGIINAFTTTTSGIVAADTDVTGSSTISNAQLNNGDVTLSSNVTLTLDGSTVTGSSFNDTASGVTIQVDGGDTLALSGATINGGTINAFASSPSGGIVAADIDVIGSSTISDARLNNGDVTLSSNVTLNLDGSTITGSSFNDIASGAVIQVDGGDMLTLNGATINGGIINAFTTTTTGGIVAGDINVTGSSTISNATVDNGDVTLGSNVTLTLDGTTVTGSSFNDTASGATIQLDGGDTLALSGASINGGAINAFTTITTSGATVAGDIDITGSSAISNAHLNNGDVTLGSNVTLNLDGNTITGSSFDDIASGATIQLDGGDTLALSGASINGGAINAFTTITTSGATVAADIDITGSSTIGNAALNNGAVTLGGNVTLTLDGSTVTGTSFDGAAGGATIQIDGGAANTLTLNGAHFDSGTINAFSLDASGNIVAADIDITGSSTISNARLNNGDVTLSNNVTLNLDGSTITGSSFNDAASGATIQLDGGDTLALSGATINGGIVNAFTSGPSGATVAGDIDVTDSSTISNARLNNGDVTLSSNVTLNLDGTTITGSSFNDTASGATIQLDGGDTLTVSGASINGGIINAFTTITTNGIVTADINVTGSSTISNAQLNNGNVTLGSNVTLTLDGSTVTGSSFNDIASGAAIQLDGGDTLSLSGATINGGAINAFTATSSGTVAGDIDVTGSSTISNAQLNNGDVTLNSNVTLTLTNDTVAGASFTDTASAAAIQIVGDTTLDDVTISGGTVIDNFGGAGTTITIGSGETLTLRDGVTVSGGTIDNFGTLDVESAAGATLDGVTIADGGAVQVDGIAQASTTPLALEGGTSIRGGTLTVGAVSGYLVVEGAAGATLDHVGVSNDKAIAVLVGSDLVLDDGTTVGNGSGTLTVDGGATLTLSDASINGGSIDDFSASGSGAIDVTGSSTIGNTTLNNGSVTLGGNVTLTLDGSTVNGTSFDGAAGGATIQIDGGAANTLTLNGANFDSGTINAFSLDASGNIVAADIDVTGFSTISDAALNNGDVTLGSNVTLTLDGSTVTGSSFDDIAGGATIQLDGGDTLTLSGATINGGIINAFTTTTSGIVAADIDVTGSGTISNAALNNGSVTLGGNVTLTLDGSTVNGSSFDGAASAAAIQIDGGAANTLTLNGAHFDSGTINAFSLDASGNIVAADIDVTGSSTISNAALNNGDVTLSNNVTLNLDGTTITGSSFDDIASGATIQLDGGDTLAVSGATINGGAINAFTTITTSGATVAGDIDITGSSTISNAQLNNGDVTLSSNVTLNLDGTTITGASFNDSASGATIQLDGGDTLTVSGATINGGAINAFTNTSGGTVAGDIDVTGSSKIGNAQLNNGDVTLSSNVTLTLDGSMVTGSSFDGAASGATIQIDGGAANTLTLNGAHFDSGTINAFSLDASGNIVAADIDVAGSSTISDAALNNGDVTLGANVTLNLDGSTITGSSFNDTASGAVIQLDGGDTLILSSATINGGAINSFASSPSGGIVAGDIDVIGSSTIIDAALNNGDVTLGSNVTLTLDGSTITGSSFDDAASGATIQIDGGAANTLTLNGANFDSGTINAFSLDASGNIVAADIDVAGSSTISNAALNNGDVTLSSNVTLTLTNDTVAGASFTDTASAAAIQIVGDTTLDDVTISGGTVIDNFDGAGTTITIGSGETLTLQDGVTVSGGTIDNFGTLDVESAAGATLDGVTIADGGAVQVDGIAQASTTPLALEGGTSIRGGTLTVGAVSGYLVVEGTAGATLDHVGVSNDKAIAVLVGSDLVLDDGTTVGNGSGTLTVDGGATLTLNDASITGGSIDDFSASGSGAIDVIATSTIGNATLNNGDVTLEGNVTLTLDGSTVNGTSFDGAASGATIQIDGGAANTLTLNGAHFDSGTINVFSLDASGNIVAGDIDITGSSAISNAHLNNGDVTLGSNVTLNLDGNTITGSSFDDIASGATIQLDGGDTLALSGASINGGAINAFTTITTSGATVAADIDITGSSTIGNAALNNGAVTLGGNVTLTLDGSTVTGTSFDGAAGGATIQIDGGAANTLTLNGAHFDSGTINAFSLDASGNIVAADIDITGSSTISNARLNNGDVTLSNNVTLNLDGSTITGSSFNDAASGATIQLDGGDTLALSGATINGGIVNAFTSGPSGATVAGDIDVTDSSTISNARLNNGDVTLSSNVTLNLDGTTITGSSFNDTASGATIQLDGGDTLTVSGASINGGIINAFTTITTNGIVTADINVTGSSTISNAQLNNGNVTLGSNVTLTLDGSTVTGSSFNDIAGGATIQLDGGDTLTLNGAMINGGAINAFTTTSGGTVAGDIDVTGSSTISNAQLNNGDVTLNSNVTLTLTNDTVAGASFTDTASAAAIQIVGDTTLDDVTISGGTVIDNFGGAGTTITIGSGETLTLRDGVTVSGGTIDNFGTLDVESAAGATLDGVTIADGGAVQVDGIAQASTTPLALEGGTSIRGGTLTVGAVSGYLVVEGAAGATLDHVGVSNDKAIAVLVGSDLVLDDGTTVGNGSGTLTVDGGATLTLSDASINGGIIDDFSASGSGAIDVTATSTIGNATLNNGSVTLGGNVTLTLDGSTVTGSSFNDTASGAAIQIDGGAANTLTLNGAHFDSGTINAFSLDASGNIVAADIDITGSSTISDAALNNGDVTLGANVTLTLDGSTVNGTSFGDTASGAAIQIDGGAANTLTLNGANFDSGTINAFSLDASGNIVAADIDITGSSTISDAALNNGDVTLGANVTLTLDGSTVTGTSFGDAASGATIQIDGGAANTLTLNGANFDSGTINAFSLDASGNIVAADIDVAGSSTISNAALNNGDVTLGANVTLTLDGSTVTGTSFGDAASGAAIQIDGAAGDAVTLSGVTVTGGAIVDTGAIDAANSNTIDGVTFSGGATTATGVIDNTGTLTLGTGGLILAGSNYTLELEGAGTLNLAGNTVKMNTLSGDTFVNDGNTISGAGKIGTGNLGATPLIVDNEAGTIEAIGGILAISNGAAFTNAGLLEAASTGTLDITIGGLQNTGTNPLAADNPGGILIAGTLEVDNPLGSQAAGSLALNGNGAVVLSGGTIEGNSSNAETLVNTSNTISGGGTIGVGGDQLALQNKSSGVIDANSSGQTLVVNAVTANAGLMEATNGGTLQIDADVTDETDLTDGSHGAIKADGGTVVIGADAVVSGAMPVTVTNGGTAELVGSATQPLDLNAAFSGAGTLQLDHSQNYGGTIGGFAAGATVTLADLTYSPSETGVWNAGSGALTLDNGATTESIHFTGAFNPGNFALTQDANGDTEIVFAPAAASASVSGSDSAGNAVAGSPVTASFTDADATGNVTYTWVENGVVVGAGPSYTPGATEAGQPLDVVVGFTDHGVAEQVTGVAGFVAAAPLASAGSDVSTDAGTPVTVTTLDVSFADAGSDSFTVTLDAGHGTLSLAAADDVTESGLGSREVTLSGTLADIEAALGNGVAYTPGSGFPGSDTLSIHAVDGAFASNTATLTVNVAPDFTGMSMNVAQGATEVISDGNFSFTNTDVSHLTYTVSNLSGGQFEVLDGSTWTTATSFTTAEVEAGQVEFVQDGTLIAPNFSITAADGAYASAAVTPTVDFTPVPPAVSLMTLQDGSFETPDLGQGNSQYAPTGSAWTFSAEPNDNGGGGIANNGSGFTSANPDAPDGDQVAFLQSRDGNSGETISQTFDASAGNFTLDFEAAQRGNGSFNPQTFEVLVDNNVVGTFDPSGTNYSSYSASFVLATSGSHTLTFEALDGFNSTDATALIDNVALVANSLAATENATLGITGFTVNSPDVESSSISVTLEVSHGALSLANATGLTESGAGTAASPLVLTGSLAAIDAALAAGVDYAPNLDFSGSDALTLVASDGGHASNTETLNINVEPGTPDFTAMNMTIAQGGTEVLSDANFSIGDPDTTHFLYSVSNVTGGEFEVLNGTNWVDAPTGGFTTQQIEAGHVEFVQDGAVNSPSFSITAADGGNVSAAISPTVNFTLDHNLIVNAGFETSDLTGWTVGGDNSYGDNALIGVGTAADQGGGEAPNHGSAEALIGAVGDDVTLSQTVATTAGEHYTIDFWVMNAGSSQGGQNDFSAIWNGNVLTSLTDVGQQNGYTEYQFDEVGAAGQSTSTLEFSARNDSAYWALDDVSVQPGSPNTAQQMSDTTVAVSGVSATDTLTVSAPQGTLGTVSATAGNGTVEWQFAATNAQLDHLMGVTQNFTLTDQNNSAVSQTLAVSIGGNGNDQFVFSPNMGADAMVNFSTLTTAQGAYVGDTIDLTAFHTTANAVLSELTTDSHGNAVVQLDSHDSITFQGLSVAQIQANASHVFHV